MNILFIAVCINICFTFSEHSRHWFFNGKLLVDGKAVKKSLFKMVKDTQQFSNNNNIIKFSDNSRYETERYRI